MFLFVQFIALFTSAMRIRKPTTPPSMEIGPSLLWFLIAFLMALGIIILALKFLKGVSFSMFFAFLIFTGTQIVFASFLPFFLSIVFAAAIVGLRFWKPNLLTHNIAIFLGVAGVAAMLGSLFKVPAILFILLVLSIYDFIAVFKTKHMISMFKDLLKRGMPLAIVVPEQPMAFKEKIYKVSKAKLKETDKKVLMLGTGDLAFPALFAVSAFIQSGIFVALTIVIGSIIGLIFNHYLLTIKKFKFIPALPFIALFSAIGYFVAVLVF
jgi:presenilin-like A22 family membrane protease